MNNEQQHDVIVVEEGTRGRVRIVRFQDRNVAGVLEAYDLFDLLETAEEREW